LAIEAFEAAPYLTWIVRDTTDAEGFGPKPQKRAITIESLRTLRPARMMIGLVDMAGLVHGCCGSNPRLALDFLPQAATDTHMLTDDSVSMMCTEKGAKIDQNPLLSTTFGVIG
jgi:hypothetical protein